MLAVLAAASGSEALPVLAAAEFSWALTLALLGLAAAAGESRGLLVAALLAAAARLAAAEGDFDGLVATALVVVVVPLVPPVPHSPLPRVPLSCRRLRQPRRWSLASCLSYSMRRMLRF